MLQDSRKRLVLDRAFDTFIQRLNDTLIGCHYARSNNDIEAWYKAVFNLFIELSGYINQEDLEREKEKLIYLGQIVKKAQLLQKEQIEALKLELIGCEIFFHGIIKKEKLQDKKQDYTNDSVFI